MKVERIEAIPVCLPYRKIYGGSHYARKQASFVIVRIRTDDGLEGWGEAGTLGTWGETQGVALRVIEDLLAPGLLGLDPLNINGALSDMDRFLRGYPFTKGAVEMALWDIVGKHYREPVHVLLGGACRPQIEVHGGVGIAEMDQMVRDAVELHDAGFAAVKIKVGVEPAKDLEVVRRVREAIGPSRKLIVDANQGYRRKEALQVLRAMEHYAPILAEQPVAADDLEGMAMLTRELSMPIIADELVWSPPDALRAAARSAADVFHVYALKAGGLARARSCVQIAEAAGIPCNIGGMIDLGIGTAAELHLSAALRNVRPDVAPCGIFGPYFLVDDIITRKFTMDAQGCMEVPMGPGLGIEIDDDKLQHYKRRVTSDFA